MPSKSNEQFVKEATLKHPTYDFKNTQYIKNNIHINVICPEHGEFRIIPSNLLAGSGCKKCAFTKIAKDRSGDLQTFITKVNNIHNFKYDYSGSVYKNNYTKIKIKCSEHGIFEQTPSLHLRGGCKECGILSFKDKLTDSYSDFVIKANNKFNNKYKYFENTWRGREELLKIECPIHGYFYQKPRDHLKAIKGCKECNTGNGIGFKRNEFIEHFKDITCTLYILKCFNETESFYKIGITGRTVKQRFAGSSRMPYNYEIIKTIKGTAQEIWDLENNYKKQIQRYKPKIKFNGSTYECFLNIDDIHF